MIPDSKDLPKYLKNYLDILKKFLKFNKVINNIHLKPPYSKGKTDEIHFYTSVFTFVQLSILTN